MSIYQGRNKFSLGTMRYRVLVQQETTTSDATTGQPTRTWSTFKASEPAAYDEVRGGENFRGTQIEAGVAAVFTVRFDAGFGPTMRVYHNSRYYGIVFCRRVRGYDRYLELHCKATDDGAIG